MGQFPTKNCHSHKFADIKNVRVTHCSMKYEQATVFVNDLLI